MKRKLKKELAEYFDAPKPEQKQMFVRKYGSQKINLFHMAVTQTRYISKWVWVFSGLLFGVTYLVAKISHPGYVSMVLGFVPFLVMLSVTESMRSYRYGMEELELSARFSLKSILLARMIMLGLGNLVLLAAIAFLLKSKLQINMVYVMTPYFLTAGGGLWIVRKFPDKEGTYLCFGLATLVCVLQMSLSWQFHVIFTAEYAWVWMCVCVVGMIATVRESWRMIRMTEDLAWN